MPEGAGSKNCRRRNDEYASILVAQSMRQRAPLEAQFLVLLLSFLISITKGIVN
jgi:hypothetical protein